MNIYEFLYELWNKPSYLSGEINIHNQYVQQIKTSDQSH